MTPDAFMRLTYPRLLALLETEGDDDEQLGE